jgi:hypothetical protein
LPVLHKLTEVYKIWQAHFCHFPRLSKFSLGSKIDTLFTDTVELIFLAGYANIDQKYTFVVRAASKLDLLKFFLQIAWETKCLDQKKYIVLTVPLNEIGKDIGGWQKYLQTKQHSAKS